MAVSTLRLILGNLLPERFRAAGLHLQDSTDPETWHAAQGDSSGRVAVVSAVPTEPATYTVTTSAAVTVAITRLPVTITVIKGAGGTMTVETTASGATAVSAGTATWKAWQPGTVSETTRGSLYNEPVTHARFTAATNTWKAEVLQ